MDRTRGVVIPAYDPDVPLLVSYIEELIATVDPERIHVELDDPSSRSTVDRILETPASVNVSPTRRGKGRAVADGFDYLDTELLALTDADGSTTAQSIADVLDVAEDGALGVGSRRHPDATIRSNQSVVRQSMGDVFAWVARQGLDVDLYDYQCGAKALTKSIWETLRDHVTATGFAWDVELLAFGDALGFEVVEVPVVWDDHPKSTVDPLTTAFELGTTLVDVRRRTGRIGEQDHQQAGESRPGTPVRNDPR